MNSASNSNSNSNRLHCNVIDPRPDIYVLVLVNQTVKSTKQKQTREWVLNMYMYIPHLLLTWHVKLMYM